MQKQWKGDKIARMEIQDLKRYSAAEVVLLGVFALGLLLALVLVKVRGNIALAEPVALPFGGVSAPLPQGPEWKTVGGWMYESDNSFVLLGIMNYQGRPAMTVRWRYALCDEPVEVTALLRQRADSAAARLTLLGQTGGSLAMSYGRIDSPGTRESYLMGVAVLEQARRLELYIAFGSQDEAFAQTVFEALANGVRLSPCPQQAAGAEQVEQFYRTRLQSLADADAPRQTVLLLKDAAERPLGYASQRAFVHNSGDGDGHLRLTTLRVEAAGLRSESDLWLSFTDTAFSWKAVRQLADSGAPRTNELRGNTAGRIAVQRSGEGNRMLCRTPMLMYEPLTTAFVAGLPADDAGPIVIDLLTETGMVVPVRISPIAAQDAHVKSEQAVRFVRLDYLHTDGAFEEMVFDADGALLGRFEQAPSRPARLWEATTPDALKQTFGVQLEPLGRAPDSSQPAAPLKTETLAMKEQTTTQTAVFAAGCFWGVEYFFAAVPGVVKTQVGYTGGQTENPTYKEVCSGTTGHAEAVRIEFDPQRISYTQLVKLFFKMHDPTTPNRQGPDIGTQYRSAIFAADAGQRDAAQSILNALTEANIFQRSIVTQVADAGTFWPAEEYHQQYFKKNPGRTCHIEFCPKMMEE